MLQKHLVLTIAIGLSTKCSTIFHESNRRTNHKLETGQTCNFPDFGRPRMGRARYAMCVGSIPFQSVSLEPHHRFRTESPVPK